MAQLKAKYGKQVAKNQSISSVEINSNAIENQLSLLSNKINKQEAIVNKIIMRLRKEQPLMKII